MMEPLHNVHPEAPVTPIVEPLDDIESQDSIPYHQLDLPPLPGHGLLDHAPMAMAVPMPEPVPHQTLPSELYKVIHCPAAVITEPKVQATRWTCPVNGCNLVMADSTIMNTHLLCHQGVDPFRCNFPGCTAVGWSIQSVQELTEHLAGHFSPFPPSSYPCTVSGCFKHFATLKSLKRHMVIHSGDRPFHCPYPGCLKSFTRKDKLKDHLYIHSSVKPYTCSVPGCPKSFADRSSARSHEIRHRDLEGLPPRVKTGPRAPRIDPVLDPEILAGAEIPVPFTAFPTIDPANLPPVEFSFLNQPLNYQQTTSTPVVNVLPPHDIAAINPPSNQTEPVESFPPLPSEVPIEPLVPLHDYSSVEDLKRSAEMAESEDFGLNVEVIEPIKRQAV